MAVRTVDEEELIRATVDNPMSSNRKLMILLRRKYVVLLLLITVVFVPIPYERIPRFEFLVVDDNGNPLSEIKAIQRTSDYTFGNHQTFEGYSDNQGRLVFPPRRVWGSILYILARPLLAELLTLAHGSTGVSADMYVAESDSYWPTNSAHWRPDSSDSSEIPQALTALSKESVSRPSLTPTFSEQQLQDIRKALAEIEQQESGKKPPPTVP